jgi:hypothetical protein
VLIPTRLLPQTVTVERWTGVSSYGDPVYSGELLAMRCRIEEGQHEVKNASGERTIATHQIVTADAIGLLDRLWLPGEDTDDPHAARTPLNVARALDGTGARGFSTTWLG